MQQEELPEEEFEELVSGSESEKEISENGAPENEVTENEVSENEVSENEVSENEAPRNIEQSNTYDIESGDELEDDSDLEVLESMLPAEPGTGYNRELLVIDLDSEEDIDNLESEEETHTDEERHHDLENGSGGELEEELHEEFSEAESDVPISKALGVSKKEEVGSPGLEDEGSFSQDGRVSLQNEEIESQNEEIDSQNGEIESQNGEVHSQDEGEELEVGSPDFKDEKTDLGNEPTNSKTEDVALSEGEELDDSVIEELDSAEFDKYPQRGTGYSSFFLGTSERERRERQNLPEDKNLPIVLDVFGDRYMLCWNDKKPQFELPGVTPLYWGWDFLGTIGEFLECVMVLSETNKYFRAVSGKKVFEIPDLYLRVSETNSDELRYDVQGIFRNYQTLLQNSKHPKQNYLLVYISVERSFAHQFELIQKIALAQQGLESLDTAVKKRRLEHEAQVDRAGKKRRDVYSYM